MYPLQPRKANWSLIRFLRVSTSNFLKMPTNSNPNRNTKNEKNNGELVAKKRIIDAKSEKNLAGLETIKTTLLQWKEENAKMFLDLKTERTVLDRSTVKHGFSKSEFVKLATTENVLTNNDETDIPDLEMNGEVIGLRNELSNVPLTRQASIRRLERTNSYRALGKVLIKKDADVEKREFF